MGNKRRVQRLITILVLPVNLASSPCHSSHHLFDLGAGGSRLRPLISTIPRSLSRAEIPYPPREFRWVHSAIGGTSCILPDFVYIAVCVHCSHPLIFSSCVVLSWGLFTGKWKPLMCLLTFLIRIRNQIFIFFGNSLFNKTVFIKQFVRLSTPDEFFNLTVTRSCSPRAVSKEWIDF